jgi:hypothetical protein
MRPVLRFTARVSLVRGTESATASWGSLTRDGLGRNLVVSRWRVLRGGPRDCAAVLGSLGGVDYPVGLG